jgi:hypothetical protein
VKKLSPKNARSDSPVQPAPVPTPNIRNALPSPTFFAEQVKKLDPFDLVETEEISRGEDAAYAADPLGTVYRRVAQAVERQLMYAHELGGPDEIARLRDVARRARQKTKISYNGGREEYELFLWFWSFHLCGRWLEAGESTVLINLPHALPVNPSFFLGQWWVRFLFHAIYWDGEDKTIMQLLGKGRGKRSIATFTRGVRRNVSIHIDMEALRGKGIKLTQAAAMLTKKYHLSANSIIGIYTYPGGYARWKRMKRSLDREP